MTSVPKIVISVTLLTRLHFPVKQYHYDMTVCLTFANYFSYQNCLSKKRCWDRRHKKSQYESLFVHVVSDLWTMPVNLGLDQNTSNFVHLGTFFDVVSSLTNSTLLKLPQNDGRFHLDQSGSWPSFVYWGRDGDWVWCLGWDWVWVRGWDWDWDLLWTGTERELEREIERRVSRAHSATLASTISKLHQIPTQQSRNSRFHSKQASDPTLDHCSLLPSADMSFLQVAIRRLLHCSFT